jgi:hypothetical protein
MDEWERVPHKVVDTFKLKNNNFFANKNCLSSIKCFQYNNANNIPRVLLPSDTLQPIVAVFLTLQLNLKK